jgi:hypothetical protein
VGACAATAAVVAFGATFAWRASFLGAVCGSILYGAVFIALVLAARLDEAITLLQRFRPLVPSLFRR